MRGDSGAECRRGEAIALGEEVVVVDWTIAVGLSRPACGLWLGKMWRRSQRMSGARTTLWSREMFRRITARQEVKERQRKSMGTLLGTSSFSHANMGMDSHQTVNSNSSPQEVMEMPVHTT